MPGEELTRFPITPQERHQTAKSSDDVDARPEEQRPNRTVDDPPDKPPPHRPPHDRPEQDKPPPPPADRSAEDPEAIEERGGADD